MTKKIVYSLKQMESSEELHLFRGEMTNATECTPERDSICGEMQRSESVKNIFICESETEARMKCAVIGRKVCGTCVSHLYATY